MRKKYILDTNVLLYDSQSIQKFRGNDIIIPMVVLEEIDKHKKGSTETAKAARDVSRFLDGCREFGSLSKGVYLEQYDLKVKVEMTDPASEAFKMLVGNGSDKDYNDNLILALACDLTVKAKDSKKRPPVLVTKDIALRVKCDAMNVAVEDYKEGAVKDKEVLEGSITTIQVDNDSIDYLYSDPTNSIIMEDLPIHKNQSVLLIGDNKKSCLAKGGAENDLFMLKPNPVTYGLVSKNKEQAFAIDLLTDDTVDVVALVGPAGTGKSIIALAAGLELTVQQNKYNKVYVCRIPVAMGKDIGFLPGSEKEKLAPWLAMTKDSFEVLTNGNKKGKQKLNSQEVDRLFEQIQAQGHLELLSTSHIRGRSLARAFIIVEEAQNASPHEIKSIVSRAGQGTKVILLGDPDQIDVPYLDKYSNGLSYFVDRMSADEEARKIFGHVIFTKSERSKLAEVVSRVL
jgi:PhoH-like ATPase